MSYLYAEDESYKLYKGKMQDVLDNLIEKHSIDCIITDPPYELNFMNKGWDNSGVAFQKETWRKCYDALKDGGYLLAFGGTRTYHRIACAIEDAGFEIRDCIMWLYGSGFPKSMNIGLAIDKKNGVESKVIGKGNCGKNAMLGGLREETTTSGSYEIKEAQNEWNGYGTALKPAYEPIIVARKPFKNSLVDNIIKNRLGGLNIDECRVESSKEDIDKLNKEWDREWNTSYKTYAENIGGSAGFDYSNARTENKGLSGRFPANVILTYDESDEEEVCGGMPNTKSTPRTETIGGTGGIGQSTNFMRGSETSPYEDNGCASRYFYCAKASKKDRDEGLEAFENIDTTILLNRKEGTAGILWQQGGTNAFSGAGGIKKNIHPTVKPIELMQYLVRLVAPKGATILDCFMGSGSTGKAVMFENRERNANYKFIGIEMTEEYLPICKARIDYAKYKYEYDLQMDIKKDKEDGVLSIFDFMEV